MKPVNESRDEQAVVSSPSLRSFATRLRVTSVSAEVVDLWEDGEREVWEAYVWPESKGVPLGELRVYSGTDIDEWCDQTGYAWPSEARSQLVAQLPGGQGHARTKIIVEADLNTAMDGAVKALTKANDPPVFYRRGGSVTEVKKNERGVPSAHRIDATRMRERLAEVATWVTVKGTRDGEAVETEGRPPSDIAATLLVTPSLHLPPLDAIVEHPVVGTDGLLRTRRGYDRESATYFSPTAPLGRLSLDLPAKVVFSELAEMLQDFEFASHSDRANVIGLMLTPILRPIIDGPVPLCAIRAAKAGTGKTLLAKAALTVLIGRVPPMVSLTAQDEDEADKRLTSLLLDGEEFVFIDNVPTGAALASAALARALTAEQWKGRIIRTSDCPTVPVRCTWVATGNNLTMSDEIARRSYLVELMSSVERPELRDGSAFRHPDLLGWVKENRETLLSALLSLVQHWIGQGRPLADGPVIASFEDWSRIVGSVLRAAGGEALLGQRGPEAGDR
jgi:putative DNA primase/helicase